MLLFSSPAGVVKGGLEGIYDEMRVRQFARKQYVPPPHRQAKDSERFFLPRFVFSRFMHSLSPFYAVCQ